MFYVTDFTRFREQARSLQIFKQKVHNRAERRQKFQKFSDKFTLHGFGFIFYKNQHDFERILWSLCVAIAIISAIYVCSMLSGKYSERTLITVIENAKYPVFKNDFPAVAACTTHRVNWGRIHLARRKFLPEDASNETVEMFYNFAKRMDFLQFKTFDSLAGLEKEPLHLIDFLSVTNVATYLSFRCEELVISCSWAEQRFDCCNMFIQETTNMGMCLVFNSIVSKEAKQKAVRDMFYPLKNSKNGEGSGLIFTIKRNIYNVLPSEVDISGVELMIKKPDQWTDWKTFHLRPNTNNAVMVKPEMTTTHNDLRSFPPAVRNCLFPNERAEFFTPGLDYRPWNCKSQCHQDYVIRHCNCTIPLFFRAKVGVTIRECSPSDYICIYNNRDVFSNDIQPNFEKFVKQMGRGMSCPCPPSCISLNYQVTLNTVPIYNVSVINTTTRIDVYYQSEMMMKYFTTLKFTMFDLTGYFGGIVTLCLGASIISGAELLYIILVMLLSWIQEHRQNKKLASHGIAVIKDK